MIVYDPARARAIGFLCALVVRVICGRLVPALRRDRPPPGVPGPWRELGRILIAIGATVLLAFLHTRYVRPWLILSWPFNVFLDVAAILAVLFPIVLFITLVKPAPATAFLPTDVLSARLFAGVGAATAAVAGYTASLATAPPAAIFLRSSLRLPDLAALVPALFLDVALALLFYRMSAALGARPALFTGALLLTGAVHGSFAGEGVFLSAAGETLLLFILSAVVLRTIQRAGDIWWLLLVHAALDHITGRAWF